jgi:predicted anti-sigma-YlaC factor YlaD
MSHRTLPAPGSDRLEEHLLICSECRDRLESTDQYVMAMKAAAGKIRESGTGE